MACPAPLPRPGPQADAGTGRRGRRAPRPAGRQAGVPRDLAQRREAVADAAPDDAEPIYGKIYLPRKFKDGFALPDDNCIDILAQCLGFLAIIENGKPVGYNLYVGGGQGQTNSKPDTYPLLAQPVCFIEPDEVVAAAEAVVKLFRDHGNRADRKRARLKYVMHDWGVEKFREVFSRDYFQQAARGRRRTSPITGLDLHHGWHAQGDGKWFLGLSRRERPDQGRRRDCGCGAGCGRSSRGSRRDVRLTPQQDVLLCDIADRRPRRRSIRC